MIYWLLHSPEDDSFEFTDIGIYYAHTGVMQIVTQEKILKDYFRNPGCAKDIRSEFIEYMENASKARLESRVRK